VLYLETSIHPFLVCFGRNQYALCSVPFMASTTSVWKIATFWQFEVNLQCEVEIMAQDDMALRHTLQKV